MTRKEQVVEKLLSLGLLRGKSIKDLKAEAEKSGRSLLEEAIVSGALSPDSVQFILAENFEFPFMDVSPEDVPPEAKSLIPQEVAWREQVIPLALTETHVTLGMVDPVKPSLLRYVETVTGKKVRIVLLTRETLRHVLNTLFPPPVALTPERMSGPLLEEVDLQRFLSTGDSQGLAEEILLSCRKEGYGLITGKFVMGRFVLEGKFEEESRELLQATREFGTFLLSGLEKAAGIVPREGITEKIIECGPEGGTGMFRVSIVRGFGFPSFTVKVIPDATGRVSLETVGLSDEQYDALSRILRREKGVYIVASPDYSGVTTTLYALARFIQARRMRVVALEDKIRFKNEGFVQIEKGEDNESYPIDTVVRTFSPDVLIVDRADLRRTLQGYSGIGYPQMTLFAGLRSPSLPHVLDLLLKEVAENPDVASGIKALILQKLVRVLCPTCKREVPGYPSGLVEGRRISARFESLLKNLTYYIPSGCEECYGTGYAGLRAIFDLILFSPSTRLEMLSSKTLEEKRETILTRSRYSPEDLIVQMLVEGTVTIEDALPFLEMFVFHRRGDL